MNLFTSDPTPAHWLVWGMLAAVLLLAAGYTLRTAYRWGVEWRELRRFEDGMHEYRRRNRGPAILPEPTRKPDRDQLASEYRDRGCL